MVFAKRSVVACLWVFLAACANTSAPPVRAPAPVTSANPASTPAKSPAITAASSVALTAPPLPNEFLTTVIVLDAAPPMSVDLTIPVDDIWGRIRNGFAIPNMESPLVVDQQAWYLSHPDFLQRAFDRSSLYLYHVVAELEKRHMPTELALLPFVESAYNPMAYSRARASGMWQFVPATGKNYNLRQDWWHDERRDVVASTDAALTYLQVIYEMHGEWTLALASYNWGEGAVRRAIEKNQALHKPTDYLSLNMPDETRNYYPKLQALKNIIANPAAFGITLPHIDNQPYFAQVVAQRDMDVIAAARFADMPIEDFKALNPSFNRPVISGAQGSVLLVPTDRVNRFEENLRNNSQPLVTWESYRVKRGERINQVAAHFGMSIASLCDANGLSSRDRLKPGQALLVQRAGGGHASAMTQAATSIPANKVIPAAYVTPVAVHAHANPGGSAGAYVVRNGDTLWTVAEHFGTSVEALRKANHLKGNNLSIGQHLVVGAHP